MEVACIQMNVIEDDKEGAIGRAVDLIRRCKGADLIVLPELWNIGFMSFDSYYAEAETEEGKTIAAMKAMARETGAFLHTGSFILKEGRDFFNASYLLSPEGEILGAYRKIHLFGFNSRESELLTPGEHIAVIRSPLATFGLVTCFDLRFPELFRRMIDLGTEIFLVCSAWPYPRLEHWVLFTRTRAVENQCIIVAANSSGSNRGITFLGHSMIVDPWGIAVAAGGDDETIVRTRVDVGSVHDARSRFPGLASRREWLQPKGDRP